MRTSQTTKGEKSGKDQSPYTMQCLFTFSVIVGLTVPEEALWQVESLRVLCLRVLQFSAPKSALIKPKSLSETQRPYIYDARHK